MKLRGTALLNHVAERIIARYLQDQGAREVTLSGVLGDAEGVDLTYVDGGRRVSVKVKADSYFGIDPAKISDRQLTFYRPETHSYGLEVIANTATREPGWVTRSRADVLFYYRIALTQSEDEVAALAEGPDDVFFAELGVDRDDLRIIPMAELRSWFEGAVDHYTPRPVLTGGRSAWYRIVPEGDVEASVSGIRRVGSVYPSLVRG
ncbi:MAG: hypothetical protein JXR33_07145 [Coriobacteriia bacterium]|nr:hypothetical protein [Coriobacteriia bacterium]